MRLFMPVGQPLSTRVEWPSRCSRITLSLQTFRIIVRNGVLLHELWPRRKARQNCPRFLDTVGHSVAARALRTPTFRKRKVRPRKGRGSYLRAKDGKQLRHIIVELRVGSGVTRGPSKIFSTTIGSPYEGTHRAITGFLEGCCGCT